MSKSNIKSTIDAVTLEAVKEAGYHVFSKGNVQDTGDDKVGQHKKVLKAQYDDVTNAAMANAARGLRVVEERICQPYQGHSFELKKGQVIRYELIDGPQILDTVYLMKDNPTGEYADSYCTASFSDLVFTKGKHYYSNTPYARPIATIIEDTVDHDNLREMYGDLASHSFVYPSGRCNAALMETYLGEPNINNCDSNLAQAFVELLGEEKARELHTPHVFMHFQPMAYDRFPTNYSLFPSKGVFKKGDHVDVLVHHDMYVAFSPCPLGDQNNTTSLEEFTCYPVKVQIIEGLDGPLETIETTPLKSINAVDWVMQGRPGMKHGKVGTGNGF